MLFNSFDFAIFLPIVFGIYWFVLKQDIRAQNLLIIAASYVFYGWWDWRFLGLIFISTLVDYAVGLHLSKQAKPTTRNLLLWTSVAVNLGILGFFKYYNFFLDNFTTVFSFLGQEIPSSSLEIILPVGISFYTFQTLSYTIDIYRQKLSPTRDFISFAAFVGFFPQLVAGPIERAANLLPQFHVQRTFKYDKAADGLRQILWGLFKKVVIADNCAEFTHIIFNSSIDHTGSTLLLGAFLFTLQIYGDFSGYSDIAIGTARLFGFELTQNFAFPFFSRDIGEFWRRWHITLSTWFRDYLYIPLGGSRKGLGITIRNIFIIFLVSGFWHGANWTFVAWGALHALYFIPLLLLGQNRQYLTIVAKNRALPTIKELMQMTFTFGLVTLAFIFFRSENISQADDIFSAIFSMSLFTVPEVDKMWKIYIILILIGGFLTVEWYGRRNKYALETISQDWPKVIRWAFYYLIILLMFVFKGGEQEFIYFQF